MRVGLQKKRARERDVDSHEALILQLLRAPFRVPIPEYASYGGHGGRSLGPRRSVVRRPMHDPDEPNALVLYRPERVGEHERLALNSDQQVKVAVVVDPLLANVLRPHQREGVRFMYECVTGVRVPDAYGCIMADEMGLGKTLQCVSLLWTLLRQGPDCKPIVRKAIVVCPSSLVKNWQAEIRKWLGERVSGLSVEGGSRADSIAKLTRYMDACNSARVASPLLIVSYETFRAYANILNSSEIGLVLCDEGHRLKNCENLTYRALMDLKAARRILISGTPIQNDLTEYFSLVHFVNRGVLGTPQEFKKKYENPILKGQDALATPAEREKARERLTELSSLVDRCVIRRTSHLLTQYLPVKFEEVVCVKLSPLQQKMYSDFVKSDAVRRTVSGGSAASALSSITLLKKLCNHPDLVGDEMGGRYEKSSNFRPELSGKFALLDCILANLKANTDDRIVLVSNYTQTLDLFEKLCQKRGYGHVRLDGTVSSKKRAEAVKEFNGRESDRWIFMLSSKAGGCGLNLIGANRLIMFDPDWNPANDDQAMARVWRDGQKKPCFVYRFLATGTIEEKIFQRQAHKKALSDTVVDRNEEASRHFTSDDLKDLFRLEEDTLSDTHKKFKCKRCVNGIQATLPPEDSDCTSDLSNWYHCADKKNLADVVLKQCWNLSGAISFVFHHRSAKVKVQKNNDETSEENKENVKTFRESDDDCEEWNGLDEL